MQIVEKKFNNYGVLRSIIIDGITDREVRSRNFGGDEKKNSITGKTVNSPGYRNFLLYPPEDIAEELKDRGCEIKYTKVQNENDVPMPYVSISVSYYQKPVVAKMYSNGVETPLDADHIRILNDANIKNMCVILEFGKEKTHMNGVSYIPIYAQEIYAEVIPNYIAEKYGHFATTVYTAPGTEETEENPF